MTSARCAREECGKMVYPMEELKCLDKSWHKKCFRCTTCGLALTLKTFKSHQKNPYCTAHYSKTMSKTEAPSKVSNPEETAKESKMHSDEKKSDKFPIEKIQHYASNCSWDWDEQRLTGYGRDFLLPSDVYMKCLQTKDHSSMKPTRSLSKKRKNAWEALKAMGDLSHFDSCEESELRETCSLAYEMLFPSAVHSDQQLARSIYDRIVPRLNALENGLLKAVQEARDKLCNRLDSIDWKSALYTLYCEEVHSIAAKKDIRMDTLDDVYRLLKHPGGCLPLFAGKTPPQKRQFLDPTETTIVNNIAKAYALILDSAGKGKGLSGEFVCQINAQVYHGLSKTEPGGKFTKSRGEVTLSMLGWLNYQMHNYEKEVDRVSLAALTHLAIYLIHTFQDGNTRTSQLVQSYILLESGYPPACIPAGKFNDYLELLGGIQGLGLRDPRQFVRFIIESLQHTIDQLAEFEVEIGRVGGNPIYCSSPIFNSDHIEIQPDVTTGSEHGGGISCLSFSLSNGSSSSAKSTSNVNGQISAVQAGGDQQLAKLSEDNVADVKRPDAHSAKEADGSSSSYLPRAICTEGKGPLIATLMREAIAEFNPELLYWDREAVDKACAAGRTGAGEFAQLFLEAIAEFNPDLLR